MTSVYRTEMDTWQCLVSSEDPVCDRDWVFMEWRPDVPLADTWPDHMYVERLTRTMDTKTNSWPKGDLFEGPKSTFSLTPEAKLLLEPYLAPLGEFLPVTATHELWEWGPDQHERIPLTPPEPYWLFHCTHIIDKALDKKRCQNTYRSSVGGISLAGRYAFREHLIRDEFVFCLPYRHEHRFFITQNFVDLIDTLGLKGPGLRQLRTVDEPTPTT